MTVTRLGLSRGGYSSPSHESNVFESVDSESRSSLSIDLPVPPAHSAAGRSCPASVAPPGACRGVAVSSRSHGHETLSPARRREALKPRRPEYF